MEMPSVSPEDPLDQNLRRAPEGDPKTAPKRTAQALKP